jgi:hypothetical protein
MEPLIMELQQQKRDLLILAAVEGVIIMVLMEPKEAQV